MQLQPGDHEILISMTHSSFLCFFFIVIYRIWRQNSSLLCFSVFDMILASFYLLYNIFLIHRKTHRLTPHIMSLESMAFCHKHPHASCYPCMSLYLTWATKRVSMAWSLMWEKNWKLLTEKTPKARQLN